MNHELSTTTIITNASSGQAKSFHQSSDCNRSESGTKRKRGRPKSPMEKSLGHFLSPRLSMKKCVGEAR